VGGTGRGGGPGRRGARARRIPPGHCGSLGAHPSEPRAPERSAVKDARIPLRFPVVGCILGSVTGAARAGSATSGQGPLRAITSARRAAASARTLRAPDGAALLGVAGRKAGRRGQCDCTGGPLRGRPRRTALPFLRAASSRGRGRSPCCAPVTSVFPLGKSLLTFVARPASICLKGSETQSCTEPHR
jgi:hypothetical protein